MPGEVKMLSKLKERAKNFIHDTSLPAATDTCRYKNTCHLGKGLNIIPPFRIDPKFFSQNLSYDEKKKLFKENMEYICLETSSFCNRKCWFCPNSIYQRSEKPVKMEDKIFYKVLDNLHEIHYDGDITFSYFNEPLAIDDVEEKRIKPLKKVLPDCKLQINTNGDFLTHDRLYRLAESGLDNILISFYDIIDNPDFKWDYNGAENEIIKRAKQLGIDTPTFITEKNELIAHTADFLGTMNVCFIIQNFHKTALDRAGLMKSPSLPPMKERDKLCVFPYINCVIDYSGDFLCCCNIYSGCKEHRDFIIGNITENDIFTLYTSDKITNFRKKIIEDVKAYPCRSCQCTADYSISNLPNAQFRTRPRYRNMIV